jgi:hypothetical protein
MGLSSINVWPLTASNVRVGKKYCMHKVNCVVCIFVTEVKIVLT